MRWRNNPEAMPHRMKVGSIQNLPPKRTLHMISGDITAVHTEVTNKNSSSATTREVKQSERTEKDDDETVVAD
jgi:hypothetical protein